MKRAALSLLLICLLLSGCARPAAVSATVESAPVPAAETPRESLASPAEPLRLTRDVRPLGEGYVVYPRAEGSRAEEINEALYQAVASAAAGLEQAIFTDYRIEHNADGIYSVLLYVRDFNTDELLFLLPLNFSTRTGGLYALSDLFPGEDQGWRFLISELAGRYAEEAGITLLSGLLPAAADQAFYITSGDIVLTYRLYEVATYGAGCPELRVSLHALADYITEESPLYRVMEGSGV